ncbi:hypothetical protein FSP39_024984 [Pinctada imbricata]|uniref:Uncharacterized protein n=1 Tax=Pinctada imbricata TaxID=66713 RepID=A0AA88YE41_PINIB|nr:hypothetical protein FSP39_013600 [Pinctada imbricata]KAK3106677.1 hypothetical protein FSP39_024984 [Pinctada imbricata]
MNAITDFNRKKQIRFKSIDDIKLLREVVANNPFKNKGKWTEIAESLSKPGFILDGRRVRERTQLLIDQHRRENAENIKASGTDEVVEEKTTLLDEILELREEDEREKREEKDKKEKTENMGKEIRKRALECLTPQKDEEEKPKRKASQHSIMDYLREKSDKEIDLKKKEIDIRTEELKLEREKFELEREERRQKLIQDKEEKLAFMELLKKLAK